VKDRERLRGIIRQAKAVAPTEEEEELRRCTLQRAFGTGPVYYLPFLLSVYLHLIC
jgi:hypothetical protein